MTVLVEEKVFLLSRRWSHHASHSGYDILGNYISRTLSARPVPDFLMPDRLFWRMTKNMHGYDRTGLALELRAAAHMATHRGCIYHLLYGDNCFNYLGKVNGWRKHRVVASFHLPSRRLAEWIRRPEQLSQLSAVIVLGKVQIPFFAAFLPRERIFVVPYAVDTHFFVPPPSFAARERNLCLFVGSHLRDFSTLIGVIERARYTAPQVQFAVVVHPKDQAKFSGVVGHFTLYRDLSEAELLALYQRATLVIQPLEDAVANTAVLEAIACGLPVVVTDIGAVREYVNETCAALVPPYHPQAMLQAIVSLLQDEKRLVEMAESARMQAQQFDWQLIAGQMRQTYEQIFALS